VRLRSASLYLQFLLEDSVKTASGRPGRKRTSSFFRNVKVTPFLLLPNQNKGTPIVLGRGRAWGYTGHNFGTNRQGRFQTRDMIRRFVFDVTRAGLSRFDDDSNVTEDRENSDLPTLASWRLPDLQLAVICRRRQARVPCKKYGVTMHGSPYLSLRTEHVDGRGYGVRL